MDPASRSIRILLVEDNPDDEFLLREALDGLGVQGEIVLASDAERARALVGAGGPGTIDPLPDVILLDLNLPRGSGRDVLRAIRANRGLDGIPIAVVSSSISEADRNDATFLGADRYLVKPSSLEELEAYGRAILALCGRVES